MKGLTVTKVLLVASASSMSFAFAAHAQESPSAAVPSETAPPEADPSTVADIVVTAQRREQSLQDVPVSVTALSAELLEASGISSTEAIQTLTPGLQYQNSGGFPQPFIRGVGNDRSANSEASVATYLDGVYIAFSAATIQDLFDVERVEVLRGPQGTLFGRNAAGGAINIVSKRPSFEFGGKAAVTAGSHDLVRGQLYLTGPISDTLAASIAVSARHQDSFHHNISARKVPNFREEEEGYFARGKLYFEPNENFDAEFGVDYSNTFSFDATAYRQIQPNAIGFALGGITGSEPYEVAFGEQTQSKVEQYGSFLRARAGLGDVDLVSISGYRLTDQYPQIELGGTDVTVFRADIRPTRSEQYSQEIQILSGDDMPFDWIVGGYYFHETQSNDPYLFTIVRPVAGVPRVVNYTSTFVSQDTDSLAAFGQATVPVTDIISLTGGLRYTREKRTVDDFTITNLLLTPPTSTTSPGKSATYKKLTYKAGVDIKPNDDTLIYGSVSRGFKAGLFNLSNPAGDLGPVDPEVLDAFEVGAKLDLLDRTLRLNLSAFHYDFKNLQVTIVGVGGAAILRNAASARMNGLEIEAQMRPSSRLGVNASIAYLDAKYREFLDFPKLVPAPTFGNISVPTDLSGERVMRSPEFTAMVNTVYDLPIGDANLRFSGTLYSNSGYKFDPGGVGRQRAYETVDASVTFTPGSEAFDLTLWGKNLFDTRYLSIVQLSSNGTNVSYAAPITGGVTLTYRFGGER